MAVTDAAAAIALTAVPGLLLAAVMTSAFLAVGALTSPGTTSEATWLIAAVGTGPALPAAGAVIDAHLLMPPTEHPYLQGVSLSPSVLRGKLSTPVDTP